MNTRQMNVIKFFGGFQKMLLVDTCHKYVGTYHSQCNNKSQNVFQLTSQDSFFGRDFSSFSTESKFGKATHQAISAVLKRNCCHQSNLKTMEQTFRTILIRIGMRDACAVLGSQNMLQTPAGVGLKSCTQTVHSIPLRDRCHTSLIR